MASPLIKATYMATRPDRDPELLAENIAREQSLELTRSLIPDDIARRLLGRVLAVEPTDEQRWRLIIGYPVELASQQVGQLLHLVHGNVSFYPRIRLAGLELPPELLCTLPGPMAGLPGVRSWTGIRSRALLMTVLKPRGSTPKSLAGLAGAFASAGGDLVKDDQNLVEHDLDQFRDRVMLCAQAIEKAQDKTGRACLYLPHVAGSGSHLERQLEYVARLGLGGVVMCPWVLGLETAATRAREHGLMWLAHPALAGSLTEPEDTGVSSAVLLGTLVRAAGADISIFPGRGGRIQSRHDDDEAATCHTLTQPLGPLHPTLPCLGGGKTLAEAPDTAQRLGNDCAVLVGGDVIAQGDNLAVKLKETIERLEQTSEQQRPGA
ncbi:hypothetical protein IC757_09570 [Wenzhouxiangella sp. AB-CW3]|uniref:RuBisCO large subunit C-terminal-like domain-containing protein n=1 Tax=Wenzhouxiangella sp. AB-CW3 TaxID=2771012 RepID=UPI00168A4CAB|nr:RuBisCO large subunit C-terminal-like domain-containing protein [Wenzhouxiangella sp. AB-CW3]QOC21303.1 hypothetical protein IC757_09570 [Wenzhouxiangella sp. AB-CW3]